MKSDQQLFHRLPRAALAALLLCLSFTACKMTNATDEVLPRNQKLPLFEPHVPSYTCAPAQLPPFDAQADAWFLEARALESAEIYVDDRDYKKIVALTRQAAERHHWKAMLNLASLYLEGRDPPHGTEDAVKLVEDAMRLGVPAAYDRMGTYHMNGTGVQGSATHAYAFWQEAARMGSPEALTFLGEKMLMMKDEPNGSRWANAAVGEKMLECAYGQGYGQAAYELGFVYSIPFGHFPTKEELARALNVLHEGVKFGCQLCAASLSIEFSHPLDPKRMMAPHLDKARAARYVVLSDALDFDPERRFPNIDKVLPLPPADLPPWNGDEDTLINAASGVSHPPPAPPTSSTFSERKHRFYLDAEYLLAPNGETTTGATAPFSGYWQPKTDDKSEQRRTAVLATPPALYQVGERFDRVCTQSPNGEYDTVSNLLWTHWRTVRHDCGTVAPPLVRGRTRETAPPVTASICRADARCPVTGTWQAWLQVEHPLQTAVNQYWRQAWIVAGQYFPDPRQDWLLDVPAADIRWHLMDSFSIDICLA
ncbi:MAG: sel1 repeat family protein [Massilia sp.]|nr:sel1 repeat family protein [Massilia sp.]